MSNRRSTAVFSLPLAVILAASLGLTSGAHAGSDADGTQITAMEASLIPGEVRVSGTASFQPLPVMLGSDPEGDAVVGGVGADITGLSMTPGPRGAGIATLSIHLADMVEETGGVPDFNFYSGFFEVSKPGASPAEYVFEAYRSNQLVSPGSLGPIFRYGQSGGTWITAAGRMEDGVIELDLNLSSIGAASPGAIIRQPQNGRPIEARGRAALTYVQLDSLGVWDPFIVPHASVDLGMAPAGTAPEEVPLTSEAAVAADGSFTGTLSTAGQVGAHVVVARACYGSWNCDTRAVSITI